MHHELRNKKRGITETEARELLERGEYGILSMCSSSGQPYGIPLSYCIVNNAIYFHCGTEGRKLDAIAANNRVSFCVVGVTEVLPDLFSTRYESVIISGEASEVHDSEKQLALEGLLTKYSAGFRASGLELIVKEWAQTKVFKITIDEICGKARR